MTRAYERSIYVMLVMPFLIMGILGFLLWRASHGKRPAPPGAGSPQA